MLPRRLRLSRAALTNGAMSRRVASAHFSVSIRPQGTGCAVIVSKKTERSAVGRHRLKRRVYGIIAPYCTHGYSLVVYARAGVSSLTKGALTQELTALLAKLPPLSSVR